jgi:hypothetical protein
MKNRVGHSLWDRFSKELDLVTSSGSFRSTTLGAVAGLPLYLLETADPQPGRPSILVAAGFHGDEPAGVWASLWFAKNYHRIACRGHVNMSLLPLVNPTGFCAVTHTNSQGRDPNRGFCHTASGVPEVSDEGCILVANSDHLQGCAADGFLSLHEDWEETRFYMYTFERTPEPDCLSQTLRNVEARFFDPHPDGEMEGATVRDGVIFCACDGSYEDYLFHCGVPRTACTETPGKLNLRLRIRANIALIRAFAALAIDAEERCHE